MQKSILTKNQVKKYSKIIKIDDKYEKYGRIDVEVRYDDECGNGHNSFSVTGAVYDSTISKADKRCLVFGSIHEEIKKYMPELAHLLKWHYMNSDRPSIYIGNTLYHARDKDHEDKEIGEAVKWTTWLKFVNYPFTFKEQSEGFWNYIDNIRNINNISVTTIEYIEECKGHQFTPKYSFSGFIKEGEPKQWYKAPFDTKREAEEFLKALQESSYQYIKTPIAWCKAVKPNLEAARSCAIWEDATLEQLQSRELLEARLPSLIEEFIKVVEGLGFTY